MTGRKIGVLALSLMTAWAVATSDAAAGDKGGLIKWKTDAKKAMAEAKSRGAGMMLYFTSEG